MELVRPKVLDIAIVDVQYYLTQNDWDLLGEDLIALTMDEKGTPWTAAIRRHTVYHAFEEKLGEYDILEGEAHVEITKGKVYLPEYAPAYLVKDEQGKWISWYENDCRAQTYKKASRSPERELSSEDQHILDPVSIDRTEGKDIIFIPPTDELASATIAVVSPTPD